MDFAISVEIAAPPDRVWAVLSDIEKWPEWTPSITSIERLDGGPLRVGVRARIRQPKLAPALWTVSAADNRSFTWVTRAPGITVTASHVVEAVGTGSRVTLALKFAGLFGGLIGRLTRRLNERYLGYEAAGLKRRSEERSSSS
jgi:carbon monoxide dehydrogenase subunit G